jgi:hypothetical protein
MSFMLAPPSVSAVQSQDAVTRAQFETADSDAGGGGAGGGSQAGPHVGYPVGGGELVVLDDPALAYQADDDHDAYGSADGGWPSGASGAGDLSLPPSAGEAGVGVRRGGAGGGGGGGGRGRASGGTTSGTKRQGNSENAFHDASKVSILKEWVFKVSLRSAANFNLKFLKFASASGYPHVQVADFVAIALYVS